MSRGAGVDPEALAVHSMVWGPPAETVDAVLTGALLPANCTHPARRVVAELVAEHVTACASVPSVVELVDAMRSQGWSRSEAIEAVVLAGVFVAAGCRSAGLGHWLHRIAEADEKRRVMARLVSLAAAVETPGGPARVAAQLGGVR